MEKGLVSGSAGFIGGYLVQELLRRGYDVVRVENFSKCGRVRKSYDDMLDEVIPWISQAVEAGTI